MKENKKTVVLGASPNPDRYSNMATKLLHQYGHDVIPIGIRKGVIDGIVIETEKKELKDIHTITIYLNPDNQKDYMDYIISLQPKRIIFNPDTENQTLEKLALSKGIDVLEACTLVLLKTGAY